MENPSNVFDHWRNSLMRFPVSVLGAVFDSLSLLVTLYIVKRALSSTSNLSYLGYLSVDLAIAVLATFWVLFAFMVSGWVVSLILAIPETFESRTVLYHGRVRPADDAVPPVSGGEVFGAFIRWRVDKAI